MLTLELDVINDHASLATATLRDGNKVLHADVAVASATPSIAAEHGNPSCDPTLPCGHPPSGAYFLAGHARNTGAPFAEYGNDLFLFCPLLRGVPVDGETMQALLHGRDGFLVYGGTPGADGNMRRTQGGIRLSSAMIAALCKQLAALSKQSHAVPLELTLRRRKPRTWWTFWRPAVATPPLSHSLPSVAAPYDELSLLEDLLTRFNRKPRLLKPKSGKRDSQRDDSSSSSSDSSSSSSSGSFRGQGGESSGGGASGSWSASDSSRAAVAGVAMGAAVVAGAALAAEAEYTSYATPAADNSSSSGSYGSGSDGDSSGSSYGGDSGSSDSGGGSDGGGGGGD